MEPREGDIVIAIKTSITRAYLHGEAYKVVNVGQGVIFTLNEFGLTNGWGKEYFVRAEGLSELEKIIYNLPKL